MEKIGKREGGQGISIGHANKGISSTEAIMKAMRDELDDIRTKFNALLAKIDADSGDTGGDADYAATIVLAAKSFEK